MDGRADGARIRILPSKFGTVGLSARERRTLPVRVRYRIGGRATEDMAQLKRWIEELQPTAIEADDSVPFMFVIAVANQMIKSGIKEFGLEPPRAPSEEERRADRLAYPR